MIQVKQVESEKEWEDFVLNTYHTPFSQSFSWGRMQNDLGKKVWYLGVYEGKILKMTALLVKEETRFGSYLNCPDGPVGLLNNLTIEVLRDYIKSLIKEERGAFFRLDPRIEDNKVNRDLFKVAGFRPSSGLFQVLFGWVLDLNKTEEQLLSQMRKTTRYEIRRSEKENMKIWSSTSKNDLSIFHKLLAETADRKGFEVFSRKYLEAQLNFFSKKNQLALFFAQKGEKIRAGALVMFYGDTATYLHGASVKNSEKTSASYALQWEIIKQAKKRCLDFYDFWGVIDSDDKKHPWYGISLFKKGFGGQILPYIKSQDYAASFKYKVINAVENFRRYKQ